MGYCKDCKHCKEDTEYNSLNPTGMAIGLAIFHIPMAIPGLSSDEDILKCDNYASSYYGSKMDEYDSCSKFQEK